MKKRRWLSYLILVCVIGTSLFFLSPVSHAESPKDDTVEAWVLSKLEACSTEISLGEYGLTLWEVTEIYQKLLNNEPQLFHVSRGFTYTYDDSETVLTLQPAYIFKGQTLKKARMEMILGLETIIGEGRASFSQGDKAVFIHDYLVQNYVYSPAGCENYDAYSLLTQGHGVCQAFSLLYIAVSRCWGVEADMVTSLSMDHAWNHVLIDGQYYHVDVTRDLTVGSADICRERLLLSDEALSGLGYRDYRCYGAHACVSHEYEAPSGTGLFTDTNGQWLYIGPQWLTITKEGALVLIELTANVGEKERLITEMDLDRDGRFSLTDVLHPVIQANTLPQTQILEALREKLMLRALSQDQ